MNQLQGELDRERPDSIVLLTVNEESFASSSDQMADLGDLPLLQDTFDVDAWNLWDVTYRDVIVLNGDNRPVGVINLTDNNLADPANYEALKQLLIDALPAEGQ